MTQKTFHFISGLPRSGSTLLSALLKQNPRFHAGITSGLGRLINANIAAMSPNVESSLLIQAEQRTIILKNLIHSYYSLFNQEVIFDTNRLWCTKMALIQDLLPQAKVIACVRDIPWIIDSIERIVRDNPYQNSQLFDNQNGATVYSRTEVLSSYHGLVGFAWSALKEAYYGKYANKLLLVEYDLLAQNPEEILRLIYDFIEEPWYNAHYYDNINFDEVEFDEALGIVGLHKVKPKVAFQPRTTILPPDLFHKLNEIPFWRDDSPTQAHRIAIQHNY